MRMGALRWAAVVAVLAVLAGMTGGCAAALPTASAVPASPTTRTVTLASESGSRTAIVHRPAGLPGGSPLVVVLHGAFGSAEQARASLGWDSLAERSGFVVAYPNGVGATWNAGHCCGPAHVRHVDDVGFLHRLVEALVAQDRVDPHRVYAVGMSNGAMMAYAWACGRPDDLDGIGPVAGALVADCARPAAVTVVAIHGTGDRNVPFSGGVGPRSITHHPYPAVATSLAPFVTADGCGPNPRLSERPPVRISTWSCAGGGGVTLAVIEGMGHEWPGSRPADPARRVLPEPSPPLDATSFLWSNLTLPGMAGAAGRP